MKTTITTILTGLFLIFLALSFLYIGYGGYVLILFGFIEISGPLLAIICTAMALFMAFCSFVIFAALFRRRTAPVPAKQDCQQPSFDSSDFFQPFQ